MNTHTVLNRLEHWGARRDWVGPDPYEGLSSPLGRLAVGKRPRQAITQAYKRLPFPPPWPLRVRPGANAKALALALSAYSTPAGRRLSNADRFLSRLPVVLERMKLPHRGAAWGYHFDVQTRNIAYGRSTPNAIATCFAVDSLVDAYEATGEENHARLALAARPFLLSLSARDAGRPFFAYVPAGSALIHNANLLVCGALARLHGLEPDERARAVVEEAAVTTVSLQRPDGLWPYGEAPGYGWVDNFHTAYTLEGLARLERAFKLAEAPLARGLAAWRERFFEPDGWARYHPRERFPLEAHSCASAIDLLCSSAVPRSPGDAALAERIAETAIRELWLEVPGRFAFRRTRHGLNKREFMRWANAPMFRALARLLSVEERHDRGQEAAPDLAR